MTVRIGSSAALQKSSTSTAAFERLAVVRQRCFGCQVLNDCFHRKRPFKFLEIKQPEWLKTAKSGHLTVLNSPDFGCSRSGMKLKIHRCRSSYDLSICASRPRMIFCVGVKGSASKISSRSGHLYFATPLSSSSAVISSSSTPWSPVV